MEMDALIQLAEASEEKVCLVKGLQMPCWVWTQWKDPKGYGKIHVQGRIRRTHRLGWELLRGEIPSGLHMDHLCFREDCWNPWHLDPVTNLVNFRRRPGPAYQMAKEQCPKGHAYSGDNLYAKGGRRMCKACRAERSAAWDAANREKRRLAARARRAQK